MKKSAVLLFVVWLASLASPALAQTTADRRIEATVLDTQGLPIVGAQVAATLPSANLRRVATSADERFTIEGLAPGMYTLRVYAAGFQMQDVPVDLTTQTSQVVEVRLRPAGPTEEVVVTATRSEQRIADVPASVTVLSAERIDQSSAVVADDVLRQVPTFSLFRRTSSIASHPTAQGVSLRGVGPSGVSRTLVLLDQVPFNDPFGGWVYWTRVPLMDAERIEIVDGATSSLYGNYAMGGVINIVTHRAEPRTIIFKPQYGNRNTPKMDLFASDVWGKLGVTLNATTFDTDGYRIVAEEERGSIDIPASVKYNTASGKLDYNPTDRVNLFFRGGIFTEDRSNGKKGEVNDTSSKFGSGGVGLRLADGSNVDARIFFDRQKFHSTFLAVPAATPPRSEIFLTLDQNVPTNAVGTMLQWNRAFAGSGGRTHIVSAGYDFRWIDGDSNEQTFGLATGLTPILNRISGGTQKIGGLFAQDIIELTGKLQLTGSVRFDSWRNYDAHNLETTIATGNPTANNRNTLADKSDNAFSPRGAVLYRATDRVSVWGSVSNGFRAPTLNELYRQFRVGAVLTLANEELGPERLTGVEAGVSVAASDRVTVRGTVFNNRVTDPVANVSTNAAGTVRQRRNLGSTNIGGFQTDVSYRVNGRWGVSGAYVFDIAKVHESPIDPTGDDLTGKYLAEVPKHRASFQVSYTNPGFLNLAIDNQIIGHQFDDDRNDAVILRGTPKEEVGLPAYSVTNFTVSRTVNHNLDIFVGVQNLFGTTYYVGTNPTTIGTPRLVNGGIRLKVGR